MSRYIDADKLHYKRVDIVGPGMEGDPSIKSSVVVFAKEIDKASRANIAYVVDDGALTVCSKCHERIEFPHWQFCPNCGRELKR